MYGFGKYQDALALELEILAKYESLLPGHPFTLFARRNLAILLRKTGRYPEAASLSESNFEQTGSQFGPRHEHTLAAMMTLSNALRLAGDVPRARSTGEEALSLYRASFGGTSVHARLRRQPLNRVAGRR
ncbi:MAG: tetratricopeptide repeat protein [Streptosporangiaceae bacterium]